MMVTPLEKARKSPDSMKAKILNAARRVFGKYGFHGTTTRMIAKEVGIDISTLYYHWGEKADLYETVIFSINEDLRQKLAEVEKTIHGRPLNQRLEIAIDSMTEYLFKKPEISNLVLFQYFAKTRNQTAIDVQIPEFVSGIARSMELCRDSEHVPCRARFQVLAIMNSIHNFISGENFFRSLVEMDKAEYILEVQETLKSILIPAFTGKNKMSLPGNETQSHGIKSLRSYE